MARKEQAKNEPSLINDEKMFWTRIGTTWADMEHRHLKPLTGPSSLLISASTQPIQAL